MKTRRLYYEDSALREFSATVVSCEPAENGYYVNLDTTAFYPEGGGQACDVGTLGGASVLDVQEQGETIRHLCDRPLEIGSTVTGCIDWDRRFDLMQQHAGEHILSGLIHKKFGYHNSGFHVGKEVMEVDFDGPIPAEALLELEAEANRAVWENVPITGYFPDEATLAALQYRTKKALTPPVRIVEIAGYDRCACCGVHPATTGQIGLIKILSCVKFHQGVRLEMVCGKRAYDYMQRIFQQNRLISQLLSAKMPETAAAVQKLADQLSGEKIRCAGLEKSLFAAIAAGYKDKGNVVHFAEGLTAAGVRELADAIAEACGGIAAVFSGTDHTGYMMCLICKNGDVKELGTALTGAFDGRGGGKPGSFQGSICAAKEELVKFFGNLNQF